MTEKPLPKDESGVQDRFNRGIKNALAMPPKPHKPSVVQKPHDGNHNRNRSGD